MSHFEIIIAAVSLIYFLLIFFGNKVLDRRDQWPDWMARIRQRKSVAWLFLAYALIVFFQSVALDVL